MNPVARLAQRIVEELADVCDRIEVAGSLRRGHATPTDIDLVAVPRVEPADLLGCATRSLLVDRLQELRRAGRVVPIKGWGPEPQRMSFHVPARPSLTIELDLVPAQRFGSWLMIRTGPAEFSRRLVTARDRGGYLPADLRWADGFGLFRGEQALPTAEEDDVFTALGMAVVSPCERR